jgi:hypothetical protein
MNDSFFFLFIFVKNKLGAFVRLFMESQFVFIGLTSVPLIPIFTLVYLHHEWPSWSSFEYKAFQQVAMLVSFFIVWLNEIVGQLSVALVSSVVLLLVLAISIDSTYDEYTIDEGEQTMTTAR